MRRRCSEAAARRRDGAAVRWIGQWGGGAAVGGRHVTGARAPGAVRWINNNTTAELHAEGQATTTAHSEGRRRGRRYFTGLAHARRSGPAEGGRQSHHLRVLRRGSSVCESCWMWGPGWSGARVGRGVGFRCNSHGCSWLLATCVWCLTVGCNSAAGSAAPRGRPASATRSKRARAHVQIKAATPTHPTTSTTKRGVKLSLTRER